MILPTFDRVCLDFGIEGRNLKELGLVARFIRKVVKELHDTLYFYVCPYLIFAFVALFKWKDKSIETECKEFLDGFHKKLKDKIKNGTNGISEIFTEESHIYNNTIPHRFFYRDQLS